jgi:hypothetical protein
MKSMILRGLYSAGYPLFEKFGSRIHEFKNIKSLIVPLIPLLVEIFAGDPEISLTAFWLNFVPSPGVGMAHQIRGLSTPVLSERIWHNHECKWRTKPNESLDSAPL